MGSKQSVLEGLQSEYKIKLMHRVFEESLNANSINQPALINYDLEKGVRETNFDALNRSSNRLAVCILQLLQKNNAKPNQDGDNIIAVCMTTNDLVITTLLAIWKAGAAYLPIDPTFPKSRITYIVGEAKPVLVIYDHYDNLSVFNGAVHISFDDLVSKSIYCEEENIATQCSLSGDDEGIAIILYTSGSTGFPKGVRIPHSAVLNKLRWLRQTFPFSNTEKVGVLSSALVNVDSVAELWGPLLNQVAVLVIPPEVTKDPSKLVVALETYKIERIVLVPTLLTSLLMYLPLQTERLLSSLKTWICCGETLTTALAQEFFNYFTDGTHTLCNFYGSTEVMGDVSYYVCENMEQLEGLNKVPIGYPLDNTVIFIMDENVTPVKTGESGEIYVAGLNLAKGYVNGREKSKFIFNRFTDNPKFDRFYKTGDFATEIKGSCIQYEGRMDSQIKVRGNRVDITEVEKVVNSIENVNKGVVLCYHTGKRDQALLAFIKLNDTRSGSSPSQQEHEIENILKTVLIDFQMPNVIIIESVPLLPNGKIDRQTLLKMYENSNKNVDSTFDYSGIPEVKLKIAKDMFEIIGKVIGRSVRAQISIKSNFYELGGDSLNSVYTVTQLRDKGYFIGVTDFITAKCLEDVLNKIRLDGKELIVEDKSMELNVIPLTTDIKRETISIIATSFYEKAEIVQLLKPEYHFFADCKDIVEEIWEYNLDKNLCFAVVDADKNIVGVTLNVDGGDQPKVKLNSKGMIIFDFLGELERPIREKELPQGVNQVLYCPMMGTSTKLNPQENVAVIQKMEQENLNLAKRRGYAGVLTSNSSRLTQQLCDAYGYQSMIDYQVNQYVHHDGSKPFAKAPDSERVVVHWKDITRN